MIRRLVLLAGLWGIAGVPVAATILELPPAPCFCEWTIVNDPTDDPIQTAAEIAEDAQHEGDPAYVLLCAVPPAPPVPSPFGIPPPVDVPPDVTAVGEPGPAVLLLAGLALLWRRGRR